MSVPSSRKYSATRRWSPYLVSCWLSPHKFELARITALPFQCFTVPGRRLLCEAIHYRQAPGSKPCSPRFTGIQNTSPNPTNLIQRGFWTVKDATDRSQPSFLSEWARGSALGSSWPCRYYNFGMCQCPETILNEQLHYLIDL